MDVGIVCGIHLADIYSTQEGIKWDCISEAQVI